MYVQRVFVSLVYFVLLRLCVTVRIGDACTNNRDCEILHTKCQMGSCGCEPYFINHNGTECLKSQLLSDECILDEQCSTKVRSSACQNGICKCTDGYLQYRKHTCLEPAKPNDICYNDAHCHLWTNRSYCDYVIPHLFGTCKCRNSEGETCQCDVSPTTEKIEIETTTELDYDYVSEDFSTAGLNEDNLYKGALQLILHTNNENKRKTQHHYRDTYLWQPIMRKKASTTRIQEDVLALTLGYPCQSSMECTLSDPFSTCQDGVCECLNATRSCNSFNTGCAPGTFQCRRAGVCVSWFFVCDGRQDCPDGTDEECDGPICPAMAYQCANQGKCFSRAVICDGKINCPNGEDELDCSPEARNMTNCPEHTFRCGNGQCVPHYEFCNAIPSCADGSDEPEELCRSPHTQKSHFREPVPTLCPFRCLNGRCRSTAIVCSGRDGCGDNSDEDHCTVCRCPAPN